MPRRYQKIHEMLTEIKQMLESRRKRDAAEVDKAFSIHLKHISSLLNNTALYPLYLKKKFL